MDKIKEPVAEKSFASVAVMITKPLLTQWYGSASFGPLFKKKIANTH
jgi:hypothetical protein